MAALSLRIFHRNIFDGINCCPSQIQVVFDDKRNALLIDSYVAIVSAAIQTWSATSAITARASDLVSGMSVSVARDAYAGRRCCAAWCVWIGHLRAGCRPRSCLSSR